MHDEKKTCEKVSTVRYGVEATAGVMISRQPQMGGQVLASDKPKPHVERVYQGSQPCMGTNLIHDNMTIKLFIEAGEMDFLGNVQIEDRYIILDEEGFDVYGEHFSLSEAEREVN